MNRRLWAIAGCFTVLGLTAATPEAAWAVVKDQSRIGEEGADAEPQVPPPPKAEPGEAAPPDSPELGAVAPVETVELTLDSAKRALDAFADVRDKYNDQGIEKYESLKEFVAKTDAGKRLEADIKTHGFSDVTEWNKAVTTVSFAYSAVFDGQETDIRRQIEAIRNDGGLNEAERSQILTYLDSLLPSENNKKVLRELLDDPIYRERLKLLDEVE